MGLVYLPFASRKTWFLISLSVIFISPILTPTERSTSWNPMGFFGIGKWPRIRPSFGHRGFNDPQLEQANANLREELDQCKRSLDSKWNENIDLQRQLEQAVVDLQEAWGARLAVEERSRRQNEMFSESCEKHNAAVQEIADLTIKLTKLQQWTNHMSDEEVGHTMQELYHRQDRWIKRHFLHQLLKKITSDQPLHQPCEKPLSRADVICQIHSLVSRIWYECFLQREMVALRNGQLIELFDSLDRKIQEQCPTHAVHHWRSATSIGLFNLHTHDLTSSCDVVVTGVVTDIEAILGQISPAKTQERTEELKKVVWDLIEFKQRLECQSDSYHFVWFWENYPFKDPWMNSFTGNSDPDGIVECTIFPALFRGPEPSDSTPIEKARVKILSSPQRTFQEPCERPFEESSEEPCEGHYDKPQEGPSSSFIGEPVEEPIYEPVEGSCEEPPRHALDESPETPLISPLPPSPNVPSGDFLDLSPLKDAESNFSLGEVKAIDQAFAV